jgi:adenylylsulfate reductase subunit B
MPTFVRTDKCDGCKGQDKTACMYICPHDLMMLDRDGSKTGHAMKAYNQEPEQCWECYSCVKICPQNAIRFRNGTLKRFKFPIRTTAEGSINPYGGKPLPKMAEIDQPGFFTKAVSGGFRPGRDGELIRRK